MSQEESQEEIEAGAAPEVEVDTPVTEAEAPAPVEASEEASPTEEAVVSEEPAPSEEPASEEEAPVSFPSAEEFAWDDWEGDNDKLPEDLRPWAEKLRTYHETGYQSIVTEHEESVKRMESLYNALLVGDEDPRIAEWQGKHGELEAQFKELTNNYNQYKQTIDEIVAQESQAYADDFQRANQDLFEDEVSAKKLTTLLEEGWGLEHAGDAARLPQAAFEAARNAKRDGVPDGYAMRLAKGLTSDAQDPRPGATLTSGATTPARSAEQSEMSETEAMSLKDFRHHVARNALNRRR